MLIPLLSACSTVVSESGGLYVPEYSKKVQKQAADEIVGGACPVIGGVFMPDYLILRDQARVK